MLGSFEQFGSSLGQWEELGLGLSECCEYVQNPGVCTGQDDLVKLVDTGSPVDTSQYGKQEQEELAVQAPLLSVTVD